MVAATTVKSYPVGPMLQSAQNCLHNSELLRVMLLLLTKNVFLVSLSVLLKMPMVWQLRQKKNVTVAAIAALLKNTITLRGREINCHNSSPPMPVVRMTKYSNGNAMATATTAAANVRNKGGRTAFNSYKTPACCNKFKVPGKSSKSVRLTLGGLSLLIGTCFDGAAIPFTKGYSLVS